MKRCDDIPTGRRGTGKLRLLASSDLHAQIWPHDYDRDEPTSGMGLARLATVIRKARAECAVSLLLDNGDLLQGTQLADDQAAMPGCPHPLYAVMNELGYDAATVGNHDFNYGLPYLEQRLTEANFPYVCCNIVRRKGADAAQDTLFLPPYNLLERDVPLIGGGSEPIRIAVVGAATPLILKWDHDLLAGLLEARGIAPAVAAWSAQARAEGADLVVALCHSGTGSLDSEEMADNASLAVAALDTVDAVICGHSHRRLPGTDYVGHEGISAHLGRLAGKPAVMPGALGSDLGIIDLDLQRGRGGWTVTGARSELRPVRDHPPAADVLKATRRAHLRTRRAARRSLAHLSTPLSGLFPLAGHTDSLRIVADAQSWRARQLCGVASSGLPLLSAVAPFRAGDAGATAFTYIPAGPLRRGHLAELAPFPNVLTVLDVDGRMLRLWLERGASGYNLIAPGDRDVPLVNPAAASYNFETIHGITYGIDLTRPGWFEPEGAPLCQSDETGRIVDMRYDGRGIKPQDRFAVVTNTYRAGGGGRFPGLATCRRIATADDTLRDALAAYVSVAKPVAAPPPRDVWHFSPVEATARVLSAPWARAEDAMGPHRLERIGRAPTGHSLFRVYLSH